MDFDFDSLNPTFQDLGGYDRDPEDYEDTYEDDYDDEEYWSIKQRRTPLEYEYEYQ
jgi:hypothetical protein